MSIHTKLASRGTALLMALAAMAWLAVASVPAHAASTGLSVTGTIDEGTDTLSFRGLVQVSSRLAQDPDFNRPTLVVTFDFSGLSAVAARGKRTYVVPTPTVVQRRLAPSHVVEFTVPVVEVGKSLLTARSVLATFNLSFDVTTGVVTQGTVTVAKSPF